MTAPALIAMAHCASDPTSIAGLRHITDALRALRPGLSVTHATLPSSAAPLADHSLPRVAARLSAEGAQEAVVVPLRISESSRPCPDMVEALIAARRSAPDLAIDVTAALGPHPGFLSVLDQRVKQALQARRARQLDGLVLAATGSDDPATVAAVKRLARAWSSRHRLPVSAAFAADSPPSTGEAVRALHAQGRRYVAVGALFLAGGTLYARAEELALEAGAIAVSSPLGDDFEVLRTILARYAVGAVGLVDV